MPDIAWKLAALLLVVTFSWSAVVKAVRPRLWRETLARYRLPRPLGGAGLFGAPLLELAVAAGVVAGLVHPAGALALGLLAGFSLAVLRLRSIEGDRLPCGCFGKTTARDYRLILARNGLLAAAAAVVLSAPRDADLFSGLAAPRPSELVPAFLVLLGIALALWLAITVASSFGKGRS
ncbi:MAG: MauE/DoxX family redox-associated membrane protein [Actinomycetota bacterium]